MSADTSARQAPRIVSKEEWRAARIALLAKEKELTAMKDALAAARRALPWGPAAQHVRPRRHRRPADLNRKHA